MKSVIVKKGVQKEDQTPVANVMSFPGDDSTMSSFNFFVSENGMRRRQMFCCAQKYDTFPVSTDVDIGDLSRRGKSVPGVELHIYAQEYLRLAFPNALLPSVFDVCGFRLPCVHVVNDCFLSLANHT